MQSPSSRAATPANRFRPLIEEAIASGVDLSFQVLQLTHGDTAKLRRDPDVRDDEISFRDGTMRFLGVRVVEGSPASALADADGVIITPNPSGASDPKAAKAAKKASKPVRRPKANKTSAAESLFPSLSSPQR